MIKYECDNCGEVNVTAETYGPGVVPNLRPYVYSADGMCLEIHPHKGGMEDHICGKCVLDTVEKMLEEVRPSGSRTYIVSTDSSVVMPDVRSGGELSDASTDDDSEASKPKHTYGDTLPAGY